MVKSENQEDPQARGFSSPPNFFKIKVCSKCCALGSTATASKVDDYFTLAASSAPALNFTTFLAGISILAPVEGLTPA